MKPSLVATWFLACCFWLFLGFLPQKAMAPIMPIEASDLLGSTKNIPAGDTLNHRFPRDPMAKPVWYQSLMNVSKAEQEMHAINARKAFIRGYW